MAVSISTMAVSKKRSPSELQYCEANEKEDLVDGAHEISSIYSQDEDIETEEELDRRLQLEATELGINVDQITSFIPVHEVQDTAACVAPTPLVLEPSASSRFSQSTFPTSCSSSEQQPVTHSSSFTTFSMPSGTPSILSLSSRKSSYLKFKRGFRRISGFRKRKLVISHPTLISPLIVPKAHMVVQSESDVVATIVSLKKLSFSAGRGEVKDATLVREQYPFTGPIYDPSATRRSLESEQLRTLRAKHIEEQSKVTEVQREQRRDAQAEHEGQKVELLSDYQRREQSTRDRHHHALIVMEDRHLSAEVDLHSTLESERQACETRLRHMEAYCNSSTLIEGMPVRRVTVKDFRGLAQQYHVRDGMESLHDSRINVLRERQAKQVETVIARQKEELATLDRQCQSDLGKLELAFSQIAADGRLASEDRRLILTRRWALAEEIVRRRLEIETGEEYAPLTPIGWTED